MIWFAFYLSLSTSLYKTFDEITKTSNSEYFNKNDLNESQLRIVLNQRGVVSTHLLNGKDLELAINATGRKFLLAHYFIITVRVNKFWLYFLRVKRLIFNAKIYFDEKCDFYCN